MHKLREDNRNTPKFFDDCLIKRMEKYNGLNPYDDERFGEMVKYFKGGKFLDLGIGDSPAGLHLIERFSSSEFHGLDFSSELIKYLQKNYPGINYILGNVLNTPYRDNYFDYIIAGELIEHIENPKELLNEVFRILKPNGVFSLSTPDRENVTRIGVIDFTHIWSFEEEDIKNLLEQYGKVETQIFIKEKYPKIIAHCRKYGSN